MPSEKPDALEHHPHWSLLLALTIGAAMLPVFILASGAPVGDPDVARLATFHLRADFWVRAGLTALYFPAIIALHFAMQPKAAAARSLYLCGFAFFVAGNAIDLPFRMVQFLTVGGVWGAQWLEAGDALARAAAASKIEAFAELAPAISLSFSLFFSVARLTMGAALWMTGSTALRLAGGATILTGLWNAATVLKEVPALSALSALGSYYLWIWLAGIIALGAAGIASARPTFRPRKSNANGPG